LPATSSVPAQTSPSMRPSGPMIRVSSVVTEPKISQSIVTRPENFRLPSKERCGPRIEDFSSR
jgi:hypothetical protein